MTIVKETVALDAAPSDVWSTMGDFDDLASWHPAVVSCVVDSDGASRLRQLTLGDGSKISERLDSQDDDARTYTYSILDAGSLPVRDYQSTIAVAADGSGATVTWSCEFEPHGASETDAQAAISGVYTSGFSTLLEKFGAA